MSDPWPRGYWAADLPGCDRPLGGTSPLDGAVIKACPEDFHVVEIPAVAPTGRGEHLLLRLEKTGLGSPQLAAELARAFDVADVAVGYAGMKDKHAVTEQWFSVHTPQDQVPPLAGVRLLEATRHQRKLRRGELAGNRFRITLRDVSGSAWAERLTTIGELGVPNYFGPQRFGGDNLELARRWLPERRRRRIAAFRSGLYLSVLRSFLFNEVLAARVRAGAWRQLMDGDAPMALPRPLRETAAEEAAAAEQVPTGPLWGRGRPLVSGAALALEQAALEPHRALCEGLEHAGLVQQRRSLVLRPEGLTWQRQGDIVTLEFVLPPGGYATVLLAEAFDLRDAARQHVAV